jgi:hypothetical protein
VRQKNHQAVEPSGSRTIRLEAIHQNISSVWAVYSTMHAEDASHPYTSRFKLALTLTLNPWTSGYNKQTNKQNIKVWQV